MKKELTTDEVKEIMSKGRWLSYQDSLKKRELIKLLSEIKISQEVIDKILEMCNTEKRMILFNNNLKELIDSGFQVTEDRVLRIAWYAKEAITQ